MKQLGVFAIIVGLLLVGGTALGVSFVTDTPQSSYTKEITESVATTTPIQQEILEPEEPIFQVTHVETPEPVKALYMTSWAAGTASLRKHVLNLIRTTEVNSVVIDIKDDTGKVSFLLDGFEVNEYGSSENRIPNIREYIGALHDEGIYVIGRISVFQDPYLTKQRPDLAVKRADNGEVWKDRKGLAFLRQDSQEVWDYVADLARAAYEVGFDEINFDYVRFPSDGDIKNIDYALGEGETRADIIEKFFAYLADELGDEGMVRSADLFGMVTTNTDDLGIGQVLEQALPHFDYIAPMVYPSHYPNGFAGYSNPNNYPYEIVYYAMSRASARAEAMGESPLKLRPWLQDFDYGGNYGYDEVRAQIQATYDAGLTSWMIWDPSNRYTPSAYEKVTTEETDGN